MGSLINWTKMMKFVFFLHHFEAVLREQLQRFDRCMLNSIEPSNPQGMSVTTSPNSWWGGSWSPKICSQTFPNTWVGFWMSRISWTVPVGVWNLHLKIHLQCDRYVVTRRPPSGFRKASFISLYLFMCIFPVHVNDPSHIKTIKHQEVQVNQKIFAP